MCGSWWEGKLRLQNEEAVLALPGLSLSLHISIPFFSHTCRSHSTGGGTNKPARRHCGICPQIPVLKHFFFFHQVKKLLFLQAQLHFAMGKNVNLLEFSWEQNLIIPRAWQVLPHNVTSPPEPTFAFRKPNRKLWQRWEMGPVFMRIQMTPEECFVFCHRFGLVNVLLLKK